MPPNRYRGPPMTLAHMRANGVRSLWVVSELCRLKRLRTHNDDQKTGVDIVRKALSAPARQIVSNAGEDGSVVVGKILEKDQYNHGFDAQNGEYVNLVAKGIIAECRVDRRASDYHGSHGRRKAQEGQRGCGYARRRHGWHGLLGPRLTQGPGFLSGPFS